MSGTSFFQTLVNVVNAITGYGLLAMPFALAEGGWLSLAALILLAVICTYTAMLLQRCMDANTLVKTYQDIGQLAFGNKGRSLMSILMNAELYFAAIGLLIIDGDNISILFPGVEVHVFGMSIKGSQAFIALSTIVILPTTWQRNLHVLSYLSLANFAVFFFLLILIVWIGAFQGVGFHEKGSVVNWAHLPTSLSIFTFSYTGHSIMPTVYASMKDPRKFSKVLIVGFTVSTILYVLLAIIGYLMFGEGAKSIVTLNLPITLVTSKIAIWTVIVIPLVKYALIMTPVINSLEEKLQITRRLTSILLRTTLVISTAVIAIEMPFFTYLISLTGSLISSMASIIMPCLCYVKIFRGSLKWGVEVFLITCIVGVGALVAILGTYVSIKDVINDN